MTFLVLFVDLRNYNTGEKNQHLRLLIYYTYIYPIIHFVVSLADVQLCKGTHIPHSDNIDCKVTEKIHNLHWFVTQGKAEYYRGNEGTKKLLKQVRLYQW